MALRRHHAILLLAALLTPDLRIHLARGDMFLKHHEARKAREEYAYAAQAGAREGMWGMAQTYDIAALLTYQADALLADDGMARRWYQEAMKK